MLGGFPERRSIEIIDLANPNVTCRNLPDLPEPVNQALGFWFRGSLNVCKNPLNAKTCDCQVFDAINRAWDPKEIPWGCPSFVTFPSRAGKNIVFAIEQTDAGFFANNAKSNYVAKFPINIRDQCLVSINETLFLSVGGTDGAVYTNQTFFFDSERNIWFEGPELLQPLPAHSCAMLDWNNPTTNLSEKIVFANLFNNSTDNWSLNLLYLDDTSRGWQLSPITVPREALYSTLVSYKNSVLLVSGAGPKIYQLTAPTGPWTSMKQELNTQRGLAAAFLIPNELSDCN